MWATLSLNRCHSTLEMEICVCVCALVARWESMIAQQCNHCQGDMGSVALKKTNINITNNAKKKKAILGYSSILSRMTKTSTLKQQQHQQGDNSAADLCSPHLFLFSMLVWEEWKRPDACSLCQIANHRWEMPSSSKTRAKRASVQ